MEVKDVIRPQDRAKWVYVLIAVGLVWGAWRLPWTIQSALEKFSPGTAISYFGLPQVTTTHGTLLFYKKGGRPQIALLTKRGLWWKVEGVRAIPEAPAPSEVGWHVWNPDLTWGILFGRTPHHVATILVNDMEANLDEATKMFWWISDQPINPPVTIEAIDYHGESVWHYP